MFLQFQRTFLARIVTVKIENQPNPKIMRSGTVPSGEHGGQIF